ncbi:phasin family protein [Massilia horti]|uniref:Phasin family protein n=1 Tax=Massilia horti TaxID=2562153 RepID=A0A4Y9T2C2_9BURK|nr:phasin family protein [Massilia horti]TFW31677.1 phasin family protein [Massilia horti]
MYPFPQSVTPAVKSHLDAQTAFINDMSKAMFRSFQQLMNLNIQLVQTMLEETTTASQQLLTADRPADSLSAAASRAQPISDKLRAYQQHVSRLAADAQVDMARVTEQHVQNTTRTARTLADEVARTATEETERGLRAQQESVRQFADPFGASGSQMWSGQGSNTLQSGQQGSQQQSGMQMHGSGGASSGGRSQQAQQQH